MEEIVPPGHHPLLPTTDLALVCRWIALNRDVILDFWDGTIAFHGEQGGQAIRYRDAGRAAQSVTWPKSSARSGARSQPRFQRSPTQSAQRGSSEYRS
jgi:hypothetical protein